MSRALRELPLQAPPSDRAPPGLLSGLDTVCERVGERIRDRRQVAGGRIRHA